MPKEKIYSSQEQRIIGKTTGNIQVNAGIIKLILRTGGKHYKKMGLKLYREIRKLLKDEGYILKSKDE